MAPRDPEIRIKVKSDDDDLDRLDRKIKKHQDTMRELSKEIARTGDAAKQADLEKAFGDEKRALGKLTRVKKALTDVGDEAKKLGKNLGQAGAESGGMFGQLFSKAIGTPLVPVIAAAVTAGAPVIGAAVNGALLAGVGLGGLAAGIASGIRQDDTVRAEFKRLGGEIVSDFDALGKSFVQPLRGAARFLRGDIGETLDDWVTKIGSMSDLVEPLTKGLAGLFRETSPGFLKALESAKPVIEAFAAELPGLGQDLSSFFESLSQGEDGAIEGIRLLIDVIGKTAVATGETIEFLSKLFDVVTDIGEEVGKWAPDLLGVWGPITAGASEAGPKIKAAGDGFDHVGDEAATAAREVKGLNRATTDLLEQFMSMDELEGRIAEGFDALTESVKENGRSLDVNTEKGRANRDVVLGQMDAFIRQRQQMIDTGTSVARANEIYNKQRDALIKLASQLGISRVELEKLLTKYNQLTSKTVTLTVKQVVTSQGTAFRTPSGVTFMGDGGHAAAYQPLIVGDKGKPELFVPDVPGTVLPSVPSTSRPTSMPFAGGGGSPAVSINYSGSGGGLDNVFLAWLHESVRTGRLQLKVGAGNRVGVG